MSNGSARLTLSLSRTSCEAVVIRADLAAAADHSGCACLSSANRPATCGLDIDVPAIDWKRLLPGSAYGLAPARICMPGAVTSGLMMSSATGSGPRDENDVSDGAGSKVPRVQVSTIAAVAIRGGCDAM